MLPADDGSSENHREWNEPEKPGLQVQGSGLRSLGTCCRESGRASTTEARVKKGLRGVVPRVFGSRFQGPAPGIDSGKRQKE